MPWCSQISRLFVRILRWQKKSKSVNNKVLPMTDYFDENFQPYRNLLDNQYYLQAAQSALDMLKQFQATNPSAYSSEHKGSPFYVLGYLSFSAHDYLRKPLL
jgi:hypothetical protein